jgi:hypothetical protein
MLDGARGVFLKQCHCSEEDLVVLMEMTLENLLSEGQLNHADFLARVDILGAAGYENHRAVAEKSFAARFAYDR